MKKQGYIFAVFICTILLLAPSCKKGEEDPVISFRSRTARLTGTWLLSETIINDIKQESPTVTVYDIKKDNTLDVHYTDIWGNTSKQQYQWVFIDGNDKHSNKERILLYNKDVANGNIYELIMLKNKEMIWRSQLFHFSSGFISKIELRFKLR